MNNVDLTHRIEARYRRYLETLFGFRDPELRESFKKALNSGHLSKGPYLEATPTFRLARTPGELIRNLLGKLPDESFIRGVRGDEFRLYQHQDEAITKVFNGHNIVVASGTASGKTESFIYPILIHLFQEYLKETLCPGVRALILYPMNALANDQRERLGQISGLLKKAGSPFHFTFGQYIGETPENENDSRRYAQEHRSRRLNGELVFRSEMRETPPHILLTNYSMLEYLLLRPDDSPLFDGGRAKWWTFLVVDEAHQYRGVRGTEMAMLIRRLKQRLKEGGQNSPFRCIATSATLLGGESDRKYVSDFAAKLFGEEFVEDGVILGKTDAIPDPGSNSLSFDDYCLLEKLLDSRDGSDLAVLVPVSEKLGLQPQTSGDLDKIIGNLLQHDCRAWNLRKLLVADPCVAGEVASTIFGELPEDTRLQALTRLVELLIRARDPQLNLPLLSARYHLFLRSLEGAFISFWPEKKIILDRKIYSAEEGCSFEIALCRECGQHYLVGRIDSKKGKFLEAIRDPGLDDFGATFLRPLDGADNEITYDDGEPEETQSTQLLNLCVHCGQLSDDRPDCGHADFIRVIKEPSPAGKVRDSNQDRADQMARCGVCGYHAAGNDPVREVVYGADGPHAVIATTIHQNLPASRRKILAFADSRQEAAYFAWYLENSYKDILARNVILKILRSYDDFPSAGISLGTISDTAFRSFTKYFRRNESDDELTVRKNIWRALYREMLTEEQRISLEGVGLVRWSVAWPGWYEIPGILRQSPWSFSEKQGWDLMFLLFDSMRISQSVDLQTTKNVSLAWSDLDLLASQRQVRIGMPGGRTGMQSWDGKNGRRARLLVKILRNTGLSDVDAMEQALFALRGIWENVNECDENAPSSQERLLVRIDDARRINPSWWRLQPHKNEDSVYRCNTCGRIQFVSIFGICAKHGCEGRLEEVFIKDLVPDHYRDLYQEDLPDSLVVEEHTAQIDHEKAREFQKRFRDGKIHVLSCSTTFELGVDLGDLDVTFLRNIPPESFNYIQRVGRVGRRTGIPGFAVTYCRRNSHDIYHFNDPIRMIRGRVFPPVLDLHNEKILSRHITAAALSVFFRKNRDRFRSVESLLVDWDDPRGGTDLAAFLNQNKQSLENSLGSILMDIPERVGVDDGTWIDRISGKNSRFSVSELQVSDDFKIVREVRKKAQEKDDDRTYIWAGYRMKTIAGEDILSFLSRKAIIPKYGFPVDVVELDTQSTKQNQGGSEVSLQRDLSIAISEFAPTAGLVANKKLWTSYALKKGVEKEWERWWYARCVVHARFERKPWQKERPLFEKCCDHMVVYQYIEPAFGFITGREKPEEPGGRPARVFTTRPYFAGFRDKEGDQLIFGSISLTTVSPGYMVVLCEGKRGGGFFICPKCGAGFRKFTKSHDTPYGEKCLSSPESLRSNRVSLGHELITDILKINFNLPPENDMDPVWFAYSLSYALQEGAAEILDVPATDLNSTVAFSSMAEPVPPIILYDNVPGGAGLVSGLQKKQVLQKCLEVAMKRVSGNCGCGEQDSCYGCLRNYRNQFAHQYLKRGPVMNYLNIVLETL